MGNQAHSKSLVSASMMSANQMHNQSRLSEGPSGIKARQRSLLSSMNRSNVVSSISRLPPIASASSALKEDSSKMKGRHRSVANSKALNASYAGRKGPALNSKMDMNSQQSLLRQKMGQAPDISNEVLDVSIMNTDSRHRSHAKVSKLPHLMGSKQTKGDATHSPNASKGGQTIEGG